MRKFHRSFFYLTLLILLGTALTACNGKTASTEPPAAETTTGVPESTLSLEEQILEEQSRFDAYCEEQFLDGVVSDGITLHYTLTRPEDFGITEPVNTLGPMDEASHREGLEENVQVLEVFEGFEYEHLREDQQITCDIVTAYLKMNPSTEDFYYYMEPLTPYTGLHVQLPVLLAEYSFHRLQDVENYLLLLEDVSRYFADILTFEQGKSEAGLFMSDTLAGQVIRACQDYVANPEENYLIDIFEDKLEAFEELTPELREEYAARNRKLVLESVIPAYETLAAGMEELKGTGTTTGGLATLPKGKEYYTYLVRSGTGSAKTPEEMIQWLEKSMNQDMMRMSFILQSDISLLDSYLDFHFHEQEPEAILEDLQVKITEDFPACPAVNSSVRYVHESLEDSSSPAFYLTPPIDSLEDQFIYVNGKEDMEDIYPTVAHEGYPGHLYQNVYFSAQDVTPLRHLMSFPGYTEGWATYVENISYEYCEGASEKLVSLMQISLGLDLKLSALADLYVNYEGYTEEELGLYLESTFGVDRKTTHAMYLLLVGDPGNYLRYVIGWMEFEEMRTLAEDTLGDAFNAKDFHQFLLDMGPAPFDVIQEYLEVWLEEQAPAAETEEAA